MKVVFLDIDGTPVPEGAEVKGGGRILIGDKEMDEFLLSMPEPYRSTGGSIGRWTFERACSIQMWLDRHPGVEKFVILDDHGEFGHLAPYHVHTKVNEGLTKHHVRAALKILDA